MLPKPEAVKVDLPSLNPARPDRKCNKKTDVTVCINSFAINVCVLIILSLDINIPRKGLSKSYCLCVCVGAGYFPGTEEKSSRSYSQNTSTFKPEQCYTRYSHLYA